MNEILGLNVQPKSDAAASKLKYYIEVNSWTEDKIDFTVKFKDPGSMSKGDTNDQAQIVIRDPSYFASKESAVMVNPKDVRPSGAQASVQEQLPEGFSEKELA